MSTAATPVIRNQVENALALRSAGLLQEALDVLTTPGEYIADFYTLRGEIQLALGRFQEAAGSYFTVATTEPDNVFAQYNLAICLHRLGHWVEASQAFQKVLDVDAHRDDARLGLGACLLHLDRAESALSNFDNCWSEAARLRALFGKAVALQLLHRFDEAEATYERLLSSEPNSEEALSNLVVLSIDAGDHEAARRRALRLLEISPHSTVALQCLAGLALERREYEAAVRFCGRIVERAPDCMEAWHNLRFASGRVMSGLSAPETAIGPALGRK
jgi:tetratricopeptide (TPR) repeat protein